MVKNAPLCSGSSEGKPFRDIMYLILKVKSSSIWILGAQGHASTFTLCHGHLKEAILLHFKDISKALPFENLCLLNLCLFHLCLLNLCLFHPCLFHSCLFHSCLFHSCLFHPCLFYSCLLTSCLLTSCLFTGEPKKLLLVKESSVKNLK